MTMIESSTTGAILVTTATAARRRQYRSSSSSSSSSNCNGALTMLILVFLGVRAFSSPSLQVLFVASYTVPAGSSSVLVRQNNGRLLRAKRRRSKSSGCIPPLVVYSSSSANEELEGEEEEKKEISILSSSSGSNSKSRSSSRSSSSSSKREMLKFALPALGIFIANPLLSNIDNAFVGRTVGTTGLAALSPATICTDQVLYLFSFLSRATTGLVSLSRSGATTPAEQTAAAANAGSPPLTVALMCGLLLSLLYAVGTPTMLALLRVTPALRPSAAAYIYWRGAIAWAALGQSVALSILLATQDAITPLKIVGLAAVVNVIGDYLLCVYPYQWGVAGAAAATAFATVFSSFFMIRALAKKHILPKIKLPTKQELSALLEFTGPLLAITVTRLYGFTNMQLTAMTLGVKQTAAYQLCINLVIFFLLFAEPLSQLSQTQLPELMNSKTDRSQDIRNNFKSVLSLGGITALVIGTIAGVATYCGSAIFSSDPVVQALAQEAAPAVFATVATSIFSVTVDGAMLASKDFGFMLSLGTLTMTVQLLLLRLYCTNITQIFGTFIIRLGTYAILSLLRVGFGYGTLGRAMKLRRRGQQIATTTTETTIT